MIKQNHNGDNVKFRDTRFFSFLRKYKKKYITGIIIILAVNLLQLAVPRITGTVIDKLQTSTIDNNGLITYSVIILLISLLVFVLNYLSRILMQGTANYIDYLVRNDMFQHFEKLSMNFFNRKSIGDIMALSVNDINAVRMAMGRGIMIVAQSFFLIISSILVMTNTVDFRLTLAVFLPFPILVFILARFGKMINRRFRRVQESFADLTAKAQENISGIRVIKAFTQEHNEINNFKKLNSENFRINMKLIKIQGAFRPIITFIATLAFFIVMIYGGNLVLSGKITLGDFVAFNGYIGILIRPVAFIGMIISFIQRGKASASRIESLLREKPDVTDNKASCEYKNPDKNIKLEGKIEFKNLTFSYNGTREPVLKNINLKVESGKTLAVIGRIGSGKSTLASLLLRLYNTNSRGQIFIDGTDIMDIPLSILRENTGYVPQDNFLFSDTIKNNINFTPHDYNLDRIHKAAKTSQIYDNIMELPDGFNSKVGELGVNLSGGQKQRISISRALIKDPSILILDDCLSAVDTNTEKRILEGLQTIMQNRTCIFISHRISTIKNADEIIVLEKGEIIEKGTHSQLMANEGYYYYMHQKQMLEEKISNT